MHKLLFVFLSFKASAALSFTTTTAPCSHHIPRNYLLCYSAASMYVGLLP